MESVLVLDRWAPSSHGNSLSSHCCRTASYKDGTTSVRIMKSARVDKLGNTSRRRRRRWWSLDQKPPMTDGGGGTTLPAEAKIIVGGPRTRRGWGGITCSINTDACPRAAVGRSAAGRFLEVIDASPIDHD